MQDCGVGHVDHLTIESEAGPVIRSSFGFKPYGKLPDWAERTVNNVLEKAETRIMASNAGYKVVWIGQI